MSDTENEAVTKETRLSYALAEEMGKHRWASSGDPQERFQHTCICGETFHAFKSHVADALIAALDAHRASQAHEALMCRTFSEDGKQVICDKPAKYIVWGVLYGKMNVGPKCWDHAPKPRAGHDAVELDFVATMPHAAIYEIPAPEPTVKPDREQLITTLLAVWPAIPAGAMADAILAADPRKTEREVAEAAWDAGEEVGEAWVNWTEMDGRATTEPSRENPHRAKGETNA